MKELLKKQTQLCEDSERESKMLWTREVVRVLWLKKGKKLITIAIIG